MSAAITIGKVFVPGKLPEYTYNPRAERDLELNVRDYVDEGGTILAVAGPTKTGKTVLLRRVLLAPVWIDGQGIDSVDELWKRLIDGLGGYTTVGISHQQSAAGGGRIGAEAGLPLFGKVSGEASYVATDGASTTASISRPPATVVKEHLLKTERAIVIDDFHFIDRVTQRQIVRALKPHALAGVRIIFISISHRAQDVVSAEPDMTGRVVSLTVPTWNEQELVVIAQKGFEALNVIDEGNAIAERLVAESYGSPHLMQQFCREVCKEDGIRETLPSGRPIKPPADWSNFFRAQVDSALTPWFKRLLRGPQVGGKTRTIWTLKDGRELDNYGLTLAAIASTGPSVALTRDEIRTAVERLVLGSPPAPHQTTRVLQHLSNIAKKRSTEPVPTEEELDAADHGAQGATDVQPVLEYLDEGPTSALHIADPFFAFYLRWGIEQHLPISQSPA